MSDQSEREAAARAWANHPSEANRRAAIALIRHSPGYWAPDGTLFSAPCGDPLGTVGDLWLAHVRTLDAANAAPVAPDPLKGVVWLNAARTVAWLDGDDYSEWLTGPHTTDKRDACTAQGAMIALSGQACKRSMSLLWLHPCRQVVLAHARAQLAREAKAQPTPAPAVTLEEARRMCREAGDTVVTPSGYERPDLALVQTEAWEAMSQADRARLAKALGGLLVSEIRDTQGRIEGRRLRALGVTPAVLK
jgi:hypothetical protein